MRFIRVEYNALNSRQKENYNYAKFSAALADYGFTTIRLSDDWKGADLIAVHIDGQTDTKIQLKGRLTFDKKYQNRGLWIAFRCGAVWYLYDHDELLTRLRERIENTESWIREGYYHWPEAPVWAGPLLEEYRLDLPHP